MVIAKLAKLLTMVDQYDKNATTANHGALKTDTKWSQIGCKNVPSSCDD
jgi:hypothetical protein